MEEVRRRELMRALVQILKGTEYVAINANALEMYVEATVKYLEALVRICGAFSEHSGRTFGSFGDLISLSRYTGLNISQTIHKTIDTFASESFAVSHEPDSGESQVKVEMVDGQEESMEEEIERKRKLFKDWMVEDQPEDFPPYVPAHMPKYPDRHSYKHTPVLISLSLLDL